MQQQRVECVSLSTFSCMTCHTHIHTHPTINHHHSPHWHNLLGNPPPPPTQPSPSSLYHIRRRIYVHYNAHSLSLKHNPLTHHPLHSYCVRDSFSASVVSLSSFALFILRSYTLPCFSVESRPLFSFLFKQLHSLCVRQWARRKVVNLGVTIRDQLPFLFYPTFPWATNNNNNNNQLIDKLSLLPLSVPFLWNPTMPKALNPFITTMTQQQQPMPSILKVVVNHNTHTRTHTNGLPPLFTPFTHTHNLALFSILVVGSLHSTDSNHGSEEHVFSGAAATHGIPCSSTAAPPSMATTPSVMTTAAAAASAAAAPGSLLSQQLKEHHKVAMPSRRRWSVDEDDVQHHKLTREDSERPIASEKIKKKSHHADKEASATITHILWSSLISSLPH